MVDRAAALVKTGLCLWTKTQCCSNQRVDAELLGAVGWAARDPETEVPEWLKGFTPPGIVVPFRECGIFPKNATAGESDDECHSAVYDENDIYSSAKEHKLQVDTVLREELRLGRIRWFGTYEDMKKEIWDEVTLSTNRSHRKRTAMR